VAIERPLVLAYAWTGLGLVALAAALWTTWRAVQVKGALPDRAEPFVTVVVARHAVPAGAVVRRTWLQVRRWPARWAPVGYVARIGAAAGRETRVALRPGEPILAGMLTIPARTGSHQPAVVVGVSMPVTAAAGGLVTPGRVIRLYAIGGGHVRVVAKAARVLAVDGATSGLRVPPTGGTETLTLVLPATLAPAVLAANSQDALAATMTAPGGP
jgi:Flp pilus assembly protein CpaB